jgi:glycosyltransferase involved in cell wall biosynthesis
MRPSISVVLPVYNCPHYVGEAIDSILAQSFTDFELIVIDDGSTDETPRVLERVRDSRVRRYAQENRGLAATLNRGIELARGRYIARQDQDDISKPERFSKQVAFLDAHPDCALIGTWAQIWRERAPTDRVHQHPSDNATLKFELLLNNPFVHSSVMIRKSALDRVGAYCTDRNRQPPEDFELWSRIARVYAVANIPEVLHIYREIEGSMSRLGESPFMKHVVTICAENIAWAAGSEPSDPQVVNIAALAHCADHQIQGRPDFVAMRDIFRRAAIRVTGDEQARFAKEAEDRVNAFRYRQWELHHGRGWRRQVFRAARGLARLIRGS